MKKRAVTRTSAARRFASAFSSSFLRLGLYALGAAAAGFLLSAAQIGGVCLPAAIALTAALPFSLAAVFAYAGAALGYFAFWGAAGAVEPVAAGFLILAASCLFHDVVPSSRRWFFPLLSAGIYALTALIFLLSAPVHTKAVCIYAGKAALVFLCCYLFAGLSEKRAESVAALGFGLLLSGSRLMLLPGLPLSVVLSGCAVFLCSGTREFWLAAGVCAVALDLSFRPGYSAGAMLFLASLTCHYLKPRFAALRACVYFLVLALSSFLFGAGQTMFPPGVFLGTALGLILWKPAQPLLASREAPLDAAREKALTAASGALWSLAADLQRGCTSGLEPQSAAVFDKAAEEICRSCAKWSVCWEQNAQETFRLLSRASRGILRRGEAKRDDLPPLFLARCCHTDSFLRAVNDALSTQLAKVQYQSRLAESRQILCDQYRVLSRLLQGLSERAPGQTEPDAYFPELGFRATGLRGSNISGDYGASFRVGEWYYLLLCDGMGSGEEARKEAMSTSALLKELIESGLEAHDAMQTINGLYILRDGGGQGRFTGLAVTDDELALAAADRDHGVDGLDTGLKRNGDALTLQDAGRGRLDGGVFLCVDGAFAVDRLTQRVNDAANELVADGNGDDAAGAAHSVALADALFAAEHDDGNGVFLQVLRHAVHAAGEFQQLVDHAARKTCGLCDAVANQNDGARLRLVDLCFIVFDLRTDDS